MIRSAKLFLALLLLWPAVQSGASISVVGDVQIIFDHNHNRQANAAFIFRTVPPPSTIDSAAHAKFSLISGEMAPASGGLDKLHDGKGPSEADQPTENFFFAHGAKGGRIFVDLGSVIPVRAVNSYSWHPAARADQTYTLYASDGLTAAFNIQPQPGTDPASAGWKRVASIQTGPSAEFGGQWGVSIGSVKGNLGEFRYLLFDVQATEFDDPFGNTFFSEIDVLDPKVSAETAPALSPLAQEIVEAEGGKYHIVIDTTETPDLTQWAREEIVPVVKDWYPKLVARLPSAGFEAPPNFSIQFKAKMRGVAATSGTRIVCAADWFRRMKREAVGAVVHEMVHVVQQYGQARRTNPNGARTPGWLVEGIADYIRWFEFEPQAHGAEITKQNFDRAKFDSSYRITGNFLNWVVQNHKKEIIVLLNAAAREGRYSPELWKNLTGRTVEELGTEWKSAMAKDLGLPADP